MKSINRLPGNTKYFRRESDMRVSVNVEFEVSSDEKLDRTTAETAAESAIYHYLALTKNGSLVCEEVSLHVDGHGWCRVKLA